MAKSIEFLRIITDLKPEAYIRYLKSLGVLDSYQKPEGNLIEVKLPDENTTFKFVGERPESFEVDQGQERCKLTLPKCLFIVERKGADGRRHIEVFDAM